MAKRAEIKSLTGVRGIAAVLVLAYHAMVRGTGIEPLDRIIHHGYISVDLFFVLSGFVMAMTYGWMVQRNAIWKQQLVFLGHRIARIYPLYAVVTTACFFVAELGLLHPSGVTNVLHAYLNNLLMIQAWGAGGNGLNNPGWSISTEWGAYLLFPILARAALLSRWRVAVAIAAFSGTVVIILAALPDAAYFMVRNGPLNIAFGPTPAPLIRCLSEFTLGLLAWRLSQHDGALTLGGGNLPSAVLAVVILALLEFPRSDALLVLVFPLLIVSLSAERSAIARLLGSGIIYRLGVWSYSIYLIHAPVLESAPAVEAFMKRHGVHAAHAIGHGLVVVAVFVIAILAHRIVEVPGRRMLRAYFASGLFGRHVPTQPAFAPVSQPSARGP
jgi:peptidoglycan/LPS O-acetylase OafA/YrhL